MLLALPCWGDEILRGHAPEDKGEPREWSILILSVVGARPREVPTCAQGAHPLAARSWHRASCCRILPPSRMLCQGVRAQYETPHALAWRLLALRVGGPRCSAAPAEPREAAHAHRPLEERDAHCFEGRGENGPSRDTACGACAPRAAGSPYPSGTHFGTRRNGMPSVMDAPELMEYVETHALTLRASERPQRRRARPGCWRTLAPQITQ